MSINNLAPESVETDELVEAILRFANVKIADPTEIREFFPEAWRPSSIPRLRACRNLQKDVRLWLTRPATIIAPMLAVAERDGGVLLTVAPRVNIAYGDDNQLTTEVDWQWHVRRGSLRSVCALAVATVFEQGLSERVGICKHQACENLFIDFRSRGNRRLYCRTSKCDAVRNREYVAKTPKRAKK